MNKYSILSDDLKLWYKKPATEWTDALPIGNGRLGGMVFGGVTRECIQLNEETLWSGYPRDTINYHAISYLDKVRNLIFDGKYCDAEDMIKSKMLGPWNQSYQPLGNLYLAFPDIQAITEYYRELDIENALITVKFISDGASYSRRVFCSAVDQVIAIELTCDKSGRITFTASMDSLLHYKLHQLTDNSIALKGRCPSHVEPDYVQSDNPIIYENDKGMLFEAQLRINASGGKIAASDHGVEVIAADSVIMLLTAATSFNGYDSDPLKNGRDTGEICNRVLDAAGAWVGLVPMNSKWNPEDHPVHLEELHKKYNVKDSGIFGMNHLGPDMRIGLELGWGGLLKKIRHYRDLNKPQDTSFYDAEENLVLGMQSWIGKHVEKAREMAVAENEPEIRENLLDIARVNEWLVEGAPRTLREAVQFLAWFQSVDRMWYGGGALGQLDELLRPYYEADKSCGLIEDDEEVIWYIASLLFNDTHYSQIGGSVSGGRDVTGKMSFLILEAVHRLKIPSNIAIRIHDGIDPALFRKCVEYLMEDGTGVSYACSKGLDEGFARNGFPIKLARQRNKVGCNWTALPGIEYANQDVTRACMVMPFTLAFKEMAVNPTIPKTMDELWKRYACHLAITVDTIKRGFDWHLEHKADNTPEIVLNLFCHGTIERGLDASDGGVDIYNMTMDGAGLATAADSFTAVEQRLVNERRLTWEELDRILDMNFVGYEIERLMLRNIPRYGSGNSRGDYWALRISELYTHLVKDTPTPKGFNVIPGLFSHGNLAMQGFDVPATPNGRFAHTPISHSADPDPSFINDGSASPTAKSNAVASVQPGWGNTTPLQVDLDTELVKHGGSVEGIMALIKSHYDLGGTLVNINVISKKKLLEAHEDPSRHPDLIVRVTGYSAYFHTLSPEYRQQIVDRILA